MENINAAQNMQPVAYQSTIKKNDDTQKTTSPVKQKEHNPAKIALTLSCLAAAGIAVAYGLKTGKLQSAAAAIKSKINPAKANDVTDIVPVKPNALTGAVQNAADDVSQNAATLANKGAKTAQTAADSVDDLASSVKNTKTTRPYEDDFIGPLKKFTKDTTEPGTYINDAGQKITIDKNGTGIVDCGDGRYFVTTKGGHQQYVDTKYGIKEDYSLLDTAKGADIKSSDVKAADSAASKAAKNAADTTSSAKTKTTDTKTTNVKQNAADAVQQAQGDNIMHILDVKYKKAEKLYNQLQQNPADKKTYRELIKLTHEDNYVPYLKGASDEVLQKYKKLETIIQKAAEEHAALFKPAQPYRA